MSIYFFYGDEDYNIEQEIKKLKNKLLDKNFAEMNYKSVENPPFADFISLLRTQPMMFGNQMIVIDCNDYFSKSLEDSQIKDITNALENNADSLCIILRAILPRNERKKIDSRRKFYKVITKFATCKEFATIPGYKTAELLTWINKEAKNHEITIDKNAANALLERLGNDLRAYINEFEKLKLIAYPSNKITKDLINEICISHEDLFSILDFFIKGDKGRCILEFEKLLEKDHYLKILSALSTQLRNWVLIKVHARKKSNLEIAKIIGRQEFFVTKALENLANVPLKNLVALKQNLTTAEYRLKTGMASDAIVEIEKAILNS